MVTIRLTNTMTRKKEDFVPLDPANVRMYVCGPTVYDRAHLGNARPVIVFDVLYRLLRHAAKENGWGKVTYVRNFTDVDDKINAEAQRRKAWAGPRALEELIRERTEETIAWYHADMDALGALRPDHEPRATEYIGAMIAMIEELLQKKNADGLTYAYAKDGHVLFRVRAYKDYGKLSGRSIDDMIAGARVEVAPFKEDPMDFVLWKPSSEEEPGWESPWGRGRPGWHIECSAMSLELLGESFDIHGGGLDLQFPHHENEIAQSACAHPHASFARYWLHNEMLQVEGKKMSKSLGNFFTVRDLLEQGVPGEVIRYVFLMTHYRSPMDWTERKRGDARNALGNWYRLTDGVTPGAVPSNVMDALTNDLNTSLAITHLHEAANAGNLAGLKAGMSLLGLSAAEDVEWFRHGSQISGVYNLSDYLDLLHPLLTRWQGLRDTRNFAAADALKAQLEAAGLKLKAGLVPEAEPTEHFDPAKLEAIK